MKKRGFTVVELIVTFSLTVVICVFLLQLILSLKSIYDNSGIKTEILNKQSLISNQINRTFNQKTISSLSSCGEFCLKFNYIDNTSDILKIDYSNNILQFGSFYTSLPKDTNFKDVNVDIIYSGVVDNSSNDAMLNIKIPIESKKFKNEKFEVNVIYQFNSNNTNIEYVNFKGNGNYIVLKGDTEQIFNTKTVYVEQGYNVYDKDGNIITGNVEIDNPLTTIPYKAGKYKIKYSLKDNNGNIISQATRSITVKPSTYEITNLVVDGNFEDNNNQFTNGFNSSQSIVKEYNNSGKNSISFVPTDVSHYEAYIETGANYTFNQLHKYYFSAHYISSMQIYLGFYSLSRWSSDSIHYKFYCNSSNTWSSCSNVINNPNLASVDDAVLRLAVQDTLQNSNVYFDDVIFIDLTETFGAGNEPSKEWCDENINWFDGTKSISY